MSARVRDLRAINIDVDAFEEAAASIKNAADAAFVLGESIEDAPDQVGTAFLISGVLRRALKDLYKIVLDYTPGDETPDAV